MHTTNAWGDAAREAAARAREASYHEGAIAHEASSKARYTSGGSYASDAAARAHQASGKALKAALSGDWSTAAKLHAEAASRHRSAAKHHETAINMLNHMGQEHFNMFSHADESAGGNPSGTYHSTIEHHKEAVAAHHASEEAHTKARTAARAKAKGSTHNSNREEYSMRVFNFDFSSLPRSAQKAAFAHMAMGGGSSGSAAMASKHALHSGEASHHKEAAGLHKKAAAEHMSAAKTHAEAGNEHLAEHHAERANLHSSAHKFHAAAAAKGMGGKKVRNASVEITRNEALAVLTCNCSCEKDKAALNALSDEALAVLVPNSASLIGEGDDSEQVGEEEDTYSDPGHGLEEPTKVGDKTVKGKKTMNQWLQEAPPEVQEMARTYQKVTANHRGKMIQRLVSNYAGDESARGAIAKVYNRLSTAELEQLVQALPMQDLTPAFNQEVLMEMPMQTFLGAAGGGVYNSGQQSASEMAVNIEWPPVLKFGKENKQSA